MLEQRGRKVLELIYTREVSKFLDFTKATDCIVKNVPCAVVIYLADGIIFTYYGTQKQK